KSIYQKPVPKIPTLIIYKTLNSPLKLLIAC
ncbi:MAG: hypothetical protein ACI8UX_000887, partial [Psychromonas sp.]